MLALRLEMFQETACYKKPLAFKVAETYPLPPYSTVKGMLHALVGAKEFIPMSLSIQGSFDTIMVDYQTHYLFKKVGVAEFPLILDGLGENHRFNHMTKMPLYVHMLYRVRLLVHVGAEEHIIDRIITAIEKGDRPVSLGRWEDLVRIDNYEKVTIKEVEDEEELKNPAFVPVWQIPEGKRFIPYRLNWKYEIKNGVRYWEKIPVGYLAAGEDMAGEDIFVDQYSDLVFFHDRGADN